MTAGGPGSAAGSPGLDERYAPGEDVGPLLRAVAGGLAGAAAALAVDAAWPDAGLALLAPGAAAPSGVPLGLVWPALWSDAVLGDATATRAGLAIAVTAAVLASGIYTYGQVRRFLPRHPAAAGLAWAAVCGLLAGPALLPRTARWLAVGTASSGTAAGLVAAAAAVVFELAVGLAVYGLVVGLASPRRRGAPGAERVAGDGVA